MYCNQCQETMKNTACTLAKGVCGKTGRDSEPARSRAACMAKG